MVRSMKGRTEVCIGHWRKLLCFEVLTMVPEKNTVFWDVTSCSLVEIHCPVKWHQDKSRYSEDGSKWFVWNAGKSLVTNMVSHKKIVFLAWTLAGRNINLDSEITDPLFIDYITYQQIEKDESTTDHSFQRFVKVLFSTSRSTMKVLPRIEKCFHPWRNMMWQVQDISTELGLIVSSHSCRKR
jgi:hypothetical protein